GTKKQRAHRSLVLGILAIRPSTICVCGCLRRRRRQRSPWGFGCCADDCRRVQGYLPGRKGSKSSAAARSRRTGSPPRRTGGGRRRVRLIVPAGVPPAKSHQIAADTAAFTGESDFFEYYAAAV